MDKVIAIVGPTSSGKTALSVWLAQELGLPGQEGEVISADSRQVYRGLDIGTGKATQGEMEGVPHHLLDVADPKEVFSAAEYVDLGRKAISGIIGHGHVPIIAGGTGFYVDALVGTVSLAEVPTNKGLRDSLKHASLEELNQKLEALDPEKAKTIDRKNRVRIVRTIEIVSTLGAMPKITPKKLYDVLWIGITLPKEKLEEKIRSRLHARMEAGMLQEAERLHTEGLSYERMESLGLEYRFMAWHLQGLLTFAEMKKDLESAIRAYAKRQMTWFKKNKAIEWFNPEDKEKVLERVKKFLAR
ncbi:tRNA (adenosine(37)-N6)-dimethylallyltransferase MiaA [Candidatus Kaiserbacteria bacterium]|nr:tRNA (adenosine(37)-N6)-dimethylallyltransferase MiaA [Candidatus Kaiserbacteria bacterium]